MDFGQGKLRTISGTIVATTSFGGTAGLFDRRQVVGALLVIALLGLIDGGEPRRFEEAFDRGLRRIDARALALLAHIGRARWQAIDHRDQAPRRGEGPDLLELEPRLAERAAQQPRQILARARLHARGDFFGEQFEQKLSHVLADAVMEAEIVVGDGEDQSIRFNAVGDDT